MKNSLKKSLLGMAVGLALSASAHAAPGVAWDLNGAAAGGVVNVGQISWAAGNALALGLFPATATDGTLVAQAKVGGLTDISGNNIGLPMGTVFTYQLSIPVSADQAGSVITFSDLLGSATFSMYAGTVALLDEVAGTGFSQGAAILTGTPTIVNSSFTWTETSSGITSPGQGLVALGQTPASGGADPINTPSLRGSGSFQLEIDVTSASGLYFLSDITSLVLDITLESAGISTPFGNSTPVSASVVGNTANFGTAESGTYDKDNKLSTAAVAFTSRAVNDFSCNAGLGVVCDMQYQSSGNTFFNHQVPEPASLALLGAGLGLLGFAGLRRRRRQA